MLQCCFAVKLKKCFVDEKLQPSFHQHGGKEMSKFYLILHQNLLFSPTKKQWKRFDNSSETLGRMYICPIKCDFGLTLQIWYKTPSDCSFFPQTPFKPSSFFPMPNPTAYTSFLLRLRLPPFRTSPFHLRLPFFADYQCLRVSCGHFSFIILSKSGTALVQGDWVSVEHQDLIEFVLKWVIEATLLMQSWGGPSGETL